MKYCQHNECAKQATHIYEKKDACYTKVKSRYDVWPSAYASGALVKCRKVGAKNWGNKSKKENVNEVNMAHVSSKDLNTKKFKDLGLYLSNVLDLAPNKDFRLTTNKKLLAINIDKINPKSLQNIKKRFGVDLKQKAKEPIRLRSKSGMGTISHLGMESIKEGTFGKYDTGAAFKGNGLTIYDRNQEKSGDFKNIAHIGNDGKITIWDKNIKKEPKLMQSLKKISQEFKTSFKESVKEACWVGYKQVGMKDKGGKSVPNCVKEVYDIYWENSLGESCGYTFEIEKDKDLKEAEYQGRKVKLGKPMQGDVKKFKVYVKNPKGNTVKVNFGHGGPGKGKGMTIKKDNPKARKSFRARHNCDSPGPRHKARYWSCRKW